MKEIIRAEYDELIAKIQLEVDNFFNYSKDISSMNQHYLDSVTLCYFLNEYGFPAREIPDINLKINELIEIFIINSFKKMFKFYGYSVKTSGNYDFLVNDGKSQPFHLRFRRFSNIYQYQDASGNWRLRFFKPIDFGGIKKDLYKDNPDTALDFISRELGRVSDKEDEKDVFVVLNTTESCILDQDTVDLLNGFTDIFSFQKYAELNFLGAKDAKYLVRLSSNLAEDVKRIVDARVNEIIDFTSFYQAIKEGVLDGTEFKIPATEIEEKLMTIEQKLSDGGVKPDWFVSFETSEWLWSRFGKISYFDNTFIIASYFKSVEQLLSKAISDLNHVKKMTLGELCVYIDETNIPVPAFQKSIQSRAKFVSLLNHYTQEYRNNFMHSKNTENWNILRAVRNNTIQLMCIILYVFF